MNRYSWVLLLITSCSSCEGEGFEFSANFKFGVATAAYQVEGAWNTSGKGENVWDKLIHANPEIIVDRSNGDIACDAYSKTKEDVKLLKYLGVDFYRFSISWSRVLPNGKANYVNPDGIRYYNELIDELLANNIQPLVTMYHYDLPQSLEDESGFLNPALADYFEDYADVLYRNFGDRVKIWTTFNEPSFICHFGYSIGFIVPMITRKDGGYLCGRNLLLAHAKAYHLYNRRYRENQGGRIGLIPNFIWFEPLTNKLEDLEAADLAIDFIFGWFTNPIFTKDGNYPPTMIGSIEYASKAEGLSTSRLPQFAAEEIELIKGTSDFLGLNHYTTFYCAPISEGNNISPGFFYLPDMGVNCVSDETTDGGSTSWLKVIPEGFRKSLKWIKERYNNPEILITECGFSDQGNVLRDCDRIRYFNSYLAELLKAIHLDGCNVTGFTAWSFLDNFEWNSGYTEKFGLYSVDFDHPNRTRTPKMSAHVFKEIVKQRKVNWNYTPDGYDKCEWSLIKDEL